MESLDFSKYEFKRILQSSENYDIYVKERFTQNNLLYNQFLLDLEDYLMNTLLIELNADTANLQKIRLIIALSERYSKSYEEWTNCALSFLPLLK